jgi:FdhD protein
MRHKFHLATVMRTPGQDHDLILGLLFNEGIIECADEVLELSSIGRINQNLWKVELAAECSFSPEQHQRNLLTTASCGICSQTEHPPIDLALYDQTFSTINTISASVVLAISRDLANHQQLFSQTGGVHGVALYRCNGEVVFMAEDIGRHNACDKVIGRALQNNLLPLDEYCLVFSGRISFELIQKARRGKIPIILALGAPSALAVELALQYGITLVGFIRGGGFNVYSHPQRIATV